MIIHTAMPLELVFADFDKVEKQQLHEVRMGEITMMVEQTSPYEARIVRMISPNPMHYLDARLSPGQTISFDPRIMQ